MFCMHHHVCSISGDLFRRLPIPDSGHCRCSDTAADLTPNSITLASSELASNMFGASSELVRSWFEAAIWPVI